MSTRLHSVRCACADCGIMFVYECISPEPIPGLLCHDCYDKACYCIHGIDGRVDCCEACERSRERASHPFCTMVTSFETALYLSIAQGSAEVLADYCKSVRPTQALHYWYAKVNTQLAERHERLLGNGGWYESPADEAEGMWLVDARDYLAACLSLIDGEWYSANRDICWEL